MIQVLDDMRAFKNEGSKKKRKLYFNGQSWGPEGCELVVTNWRLSARLYIPTLPGLPRDFLFFWVYRGPIWTDGLMTCLKEEG